MRDIKVVCYRSLHAWYGYLNPQEFMCVRFVGDAGKYTALYCAFSNNKNSLKTKTQILIQAKVVVIPLNYKDKI